MLVLGVMALACRLTVGEVVDMADLGPTVSVAVDYMAGIIVTVIVFLKKISPMSNSNQKER